MSVRRRCAGWYLTRDGLFEICRGEDGFGWQVGGNSRSQRYDEAEAILDAEYDGELYAPMHSTLEDAIAWLNAIAYAPGRPLGRELTATNSKDHRESGS